MMEWKDPPPALRGPYASAGRWEPIVAELRRHPGVWALVARDVDPNLVGRIRRGDIPAFRGGRFEATSRGNSAATGNKAAELYVRFLGDDEEAPS